MDIDPGTVVANRYRITRPLGRGGMGEVFAAENIRTGRPVAVKLLRSDSKTKETAMQRFRQEARAAGSINSDHVTQVLDVEEDQTHGVVLVFELLEGESLIDRLKRTGPIPFEELHSIIEQVWMGLADAHRAGIIHRDLKPSNVFLERRPDGTTRVKILDFGISKLPKEMGGETLTEMGQSLGTFSFMPPEQIGKAKTVDHRADIYACATMIYQSLTGQLPYTARNILVMVEMKSKTDARRLAEAMGGPVDPRLEAFIGQGLERDPSKRFQTALEALTAWRELRPPQRAGDATSSSPPLQPLHRQGMTPPSRPLGAREVRADTPPQRPAIAGEAGRTPSFGNPIQAASPFEGAAPVGSAISASPLSGPVQPVASPSSPVQPGSPLGGPVQSGSPLGGSASAGSSRAAPLRGGMPPQRASLASAYSGPVPSADASPARPGSVMEISTDSAATLARPVRPAAPSGSAVGSEAPGYEAQGRMPASSSMMGSGGTQPVRINRPVSPLSPSALATAGRPPPSSTPPPHSPAASMTPPTSNPLDIPPNEQNTFDESKGKPLPARPPGYYAPPLVAAPPLQQRPPEGIAVRSTNTNNPVVSAVMPAPMPLHSTNLPGFSTSPTGPQAVLQPIDEPSSTSGNSAEFATQVYRPRTDPRLARSESGALAPQPPKSSSPWTFLLGAIVFLLMGFFLVAAIMRWYMLSTP